MPQRSTTLGFVAQLLQGPSQWLNFILFTAYQSSEGRFLLNQAVEEGHTSSGLVFTKVWFCSLDKCDLLMGFFFWQTRVEIFTQQYICIFCCLYLSITNLVVYILDFLVVPTCVKMQTGKWKSNPSNSFPTIPKTKMEQGNMWDIALTTVTRSSGHCWIVSSWAPTHHLD